MWLWARHTPVNGMPTHFALTGLVRSRAPDPGRCPGLQHDGPLGLTPRVTLSLQQFTPNLPESVWCATRANGDLFSTGKEGKPRVGVADQISYNLRSP